MLPRPLVSSLLLSALLLLVLTFDLSAATPASPDIIGDYLNEFAVKIEGGRSVAEAVAAEHGFELDEEITGLADHYVFRHNAVSHRSKRSTDHVLEKLQQHPKVQYAAQQRILGRYKRSPVNRALQDKVRDKRSPYGQSRDKRFIVHDKQTELNLNMDNRDSFYADGEVQEVRVALEDMGIDFNDPQFPRMWYLINKGQTGGPQGYDVNVLPVWKKGITGKGVVVTILDDGVNHKHKDLAANYDARASKDFNGKDNDPTPEGDMNENSHGTRCAGEVAAVANNELDALGIAFNAKIGGVRMLDGLITDTLESRALNHELDYIDIYSASWGPSDDGKTMEAPGQMAQDALLRGVTEGRGGKGALYVWATGNGGGNDDDCNCDGYVSSIYSISIGCINDRGLSTYFSESCPSTLAVIHTGGPHVRSGEPGYENPPIKVITIDNGGDNDQYTDQFMGTSAAAPLAAGAFALVLEANRDLTWRDVQNIVVETAAVPNPDEPGWTINGGGYHINHHFGFGALDVGKMVEAAQAWNTVPEQRMCNIEADNDEMVFEAGSTKRQHLSTDGCGGKIDRLEHVQVHLDLEHNKRGDVAITLVSPHGTSSQILSPRSFDEKNDGISDWTFMTVHNWGENPSGDWTLEVRDVSDRHSGNEGILLRWSITFYGVIAADYKNNKVGIDSGANSEQMNKGDDKDDNGVREQEAHEANSNEMKGIMDKEQQDSNTVSIKKTAGSSKKASREDEETNQMIDAIAEILLDSDASTKQKKIHQENPVRQEKKDAVRTQTVHLRNLQRMLEEEQEERLREQKEEEEREKAVTEKKELRRFLKDLVEELES